jgi:DNA modification methylase
LAAVISVEQGDCLDVLASWPPAIIDACVTDPPYELAFMGRSWDQTGVAFNPETWRAVYRVLKPGAHLLAFGGTRTAHRMTCAIEDAGFEIRDTLCWLYGSGFPKSLDVSKAMDKAAGATRELTRDGIVQRDGYGKTDGNARRWDNGSSEDRPRYDEAATDAARQWQGWGTALKPAYEPIILARKPLIGTVAANVRTHGTGAINVDACRVATGDDLNGGGYTPRAQGNAWEETGGMNKAGAHAGKFVQPSGRWPANVVHDGSPEVEAAFAAFGNAPGQQRYVGPEHGAKLSKGIYGDFGEHLPHEPRGDTGTASRFFYSAKATAADRADSKHPTVKPVGLMRWLVRLITPPGGTVLDPFAGSGTTGEAAMLEGFHALLIERDATHATDIQHRIKRWSGLDAPLFAEPAVD